MHTHNVNVKTAAQETAGRWGENTAVQHEGTAPLRHPQTRKEKNQMKKPQLGKAADVLPLLRIRLSDTCVIEFVEVDIRFNDCRRWQILEGEEAVMFSPRSHEKLRDVRREATIALDMHEKQADERVTAARAVLKLLAEYPTFAALAAHPARTDNA
jgi:hypothetical protein